ncbi:MAG: hypothetical protein M3P12_12810, partial [Gemmatimonadota bacterium]|nr:hypothetical protein [Gemmatimonadota bacterium]
RHNGRRSRNQRGRGRQRQQNGPRGGGGGQGGQGGGGEQASRASGICAASGGGLKESIGSRYGSASPYDSGVLG